MKSQRAESSFIVVGSNNFWYGKVSSKSAALALAKQVEAGKGSYVDPESGHVPPIPESVYVFVSRNVF